MSNKQEKLKADKSNLWKLRHTAEHVLHQAVKELYPSIHLAMGPATDDGFYCDFDANDVKISAEDFPKIEARMQEIIDLDLLMIEKEISVAEAKELFAGNPYKEEWVDIIESKDELVTVYWSGEPGSERAMVDLCAGPHVVSTGQVKAFKLLSVAGAYWHGDEKNKMLTRIYGVAFPTPKELRKYLNLLEEAKKRDHKILGPKMDLFTFSELVGPGLPLWTPKGALVRHILDDFVWELRKAKGYERVEIPHITKKELYETSGHWDKFKDELFLIKTREGHEFAMKPMNCPHHTQIYARKPHSYRELPQRYANTTMVYRDEQTGELSGLSRVRSITQDDAHVFCRKNQAAEEMGKIWDIINEFYSAVGFKLWVRLSLSDPDQMDKYLGKREDWEYAEEQLRQLAKSRGQDVQEVEGEAAFYGPKLDFMAEDSLGREWQVATIQLDMNMPDSFDLTCVNEAGEKERIVMLHAAIMGSIERYVSILIEHFGGKFPVWLSPVQVKLLPISQDHHQYAQKVEKELLAKGIRVELDDRSETLSAKIRDAQVAQVPYMAVVGDKEIESESVAVRSRDGGKQEVMTTTMFIEKLLAEIEQKK
ncbi:MAG: threonine--tRNA ligase [Candidatus Pacebacteria bacterium]|mgnify:FL=1|jgi:threonyl-tRNA synthetase|nr:threonine--tRNA ligase [Candidatus Paceibacterota bacterium]MBT3511794.1 threonine--tRNA ligase [Candidatus Paceibacterota bacterium]MBT4005118.1 threonine--tRNA ligase [Candidatus Paceibacterota bacterium]MBT4358880.1 threonine--tRNA ligase [Candidatus Paceibacterota bacterium]MBT4681226.1 threonine--tRNA ligase [Candidatus Paceibacterota bacterium]